MSKVLSIRALIDKFERGAMKKLRKLEKMDAPALNAINRRRGIMEARCKAIDRWIFDYKVHRQKLLKPGALSKAIIEFADSAPNHLDPDPVDGDYTALIQQFILLHSKLGRVIERRKDGSFRDVTSLTSKVLWCCYPESAPIFDSRACCALQVMNAQLGFPKSEPSSSDNAARKYEPFVRDWFRIYHASGLKDRIEIKPAYRGRILDNILWQLGEPRY